MLCWGAFMATQLLQRDHKVILILTDSLDDMIFKQTQNAKKEL